MKKHYWLIALVDEVIYITSTFCSIIKTENWAENISEIGFIYMSDNRLIYKMATLQIPE